LQETRANLGLVFMLYRDPEMRVDGVLRRHAASSPPVYEAKDVFGVTNRLWVVADPGIVSLVSREMAELKLYIADGHHRYETALEYRDIMRKEHGPGPWDYRMMMMVNMDSPGLAILPTHRLIKGFPFADIDIMLDECMEFFEVHPLDMSHEEAYAELVRRGKHSFLVYDGRYHILTLKDEGALDRYGEGRSRAWRELDVSILHGIIFERYLGINQDNLQDHIKYTRNRREAVEKVDDGTFEAAVLMNPPTMEEFIAVAEAGDKMPQKSTYFYPKLVTGLVFRLLDE
ncbi:MAG: DUF1015 domain-containing protein, partial [Thermoplasmata archaeon]|nr:DUF1015 domain-containing protein [Thermoplasmata archaeon]